MLFVKSISSWDEVQAFIGDNPMALVYFGGADCGVCQALKPRVEALVEEEFPELPLVYVDTAEATEVAGQYQIFAIPTLLFFIDGREGQRFSRHFSMGELQEAIERPYAMLFE